jgi:hypothetical protein
MKGRRDMEVGYKDNDDIAMAWQYSIHPKLP